MPLPQPCGGASSWQPLNWMPICPGVVRPLLSVSRSTSELATRSSSTAIFAKERSLLDLKHLDFGQNCRSSALPYGPVPLGSNEGLASALSIAFGWLTVSLVSEAITRTDGRVRRGAGASPRRAAISRSISSRWALRSIRRARRCSVVSCFMSGPFPLVEAHRRQTSEWLSGVVAHSRILAPRKADDCAFSVAAG